MPKLFLGRVVSGNGPSERVSGDAFVGVYCPPGEDHRSGLVTVLASLSMGEYHGQLPDIREPFRVAFKLADDISTEGADRVLQELGGNVNNVGTIGRDELAKCGNIALVGFLDRDNG